MALARKVSDVQWEDCWEDLAEREAFSQEKGGEVGLSAEHRQLMFSRVRAENEITDGEKR